MPNPLVPLLEKEGQGLGIILVRVDLDAVDPGAGQGLAFGCLKGRGLAGKELAPGRIARIDPDQVTRLGVLRASMPTSAISVSNGSCRSTAITSCLRLVMNRLLL